MGRKFETMAHRIDQLKQDIKEKDESLIKEHFEKQQLTKTTDHLTELCEKANQKHSNLQVKLHQIGPIFYVCIIRTLSTNSS